MKTSFKNTLKVYFRDLKGIVKNPISILIISGLCIVPSLYSFLNVIACWDAYSNTSKMQIAVVNNDKGTTLDGTKLNIGDSIVSQLKTNTAIGWRFVNSQECNIGLASGEYYSELIIPENFSENLKTITSNSPVKPELIYRVNTKLGPVANKITEVAQQNLLAQIRSSVMSAISNQIFTKLNTYGNKAKENKDQILQLKEAIINLNDNMSNVLNSLNNVSQGSSDLSGYLSAIKETFPNINNGLSQIQNSTTNIGNIVGNTQSLLNTSLNNITLNLNDSESFMNNILGLLKNIKNTSNNSNATVTGTLNQVKSKLNLISSNLNTILSFLNSIEPNINNPNIKNLTQKTKSTLASINNEKDQIIAAINESTSSGKQLSDTTLNSLIDAASSTSNAINNVNSFYSNTVKGELNSISNNLVKTTSSAENLITETQTLNSKIESIITSSSTGSNLAKTTSNNLTNYLNEYRNIIHELAAKLSSVNNKDINTIIALLQGNPIVMGDYVSAPFNFKHESIYPVANYGSGMTPVYSVLAFWVGVLLLSSLLKTEPPYFEGIENISIREKHFGKMLTFITIANIQSLIITIGAKFLLGVQVVDLPLFILSSMLTATTFAIIVFTIVSMFRTIGKAICIVLMVVQLSGTGGTYPIQAMPMFFRIVEPYLPFPYGVDVMREAIAGPYWPNATKDIVTLFVFSIIFILIGYFFKKPSLGLFNKFEGKFHQSGLAEE